MAIKKRVRFAPSPTGYLHIGGLRTALYNYLYAKKYKGIFYLRIEDTDQKRIVGGALENLTKSLKWAGVKHDEGVFVDGKDRILEKGKFGPYIQSHRIKLYQKYAHELVEKGKAYYCFCSPERLEKLRKKQAEEKKAPAYDRCCLREVTKKVAKERIKKGEEFVIRFDMPETGETEFEDVVRGRIKFANKNLDDFVILKSDGFPTYHLAHVVDDHLMQTTLVLRAEEWLSSTPKHILLYRAFGWQPPQYGHLCVILNKETKRKLSKRDGDVSVDDFVKKGYLPEAVVNFIALLGWNPKNEQEIFTLSELEKEFDVKKLNKSGAIFDREKLDWMNGVYIRKKSNVELARLCLPYLKKYKDKIKNKYLEKIIFVERERMKKLEDISNNVDFYFEIPRYDSKLLFWKNMSEKELNKSLGNVLKVMDKIPDSQWEIDNINKILMKITDPKNRGAMLWPLRVALTGREKSPSPFEVAWVLGKKETKQRIKNAWEKLK
jgi:nondiscriminating glutamyl-tRNA synthetase